MSLTVTSGIPASLIVGDAVSFKIADSDHPASIWTSQIIFKIGNDAPITFAGVASGDDHLFELTNANTATLTAGVNQACLVFSDGTNRQSSAWQSVNVLSDPTQARSATYAETQVSNLQGALAKLNTSPNSSVTFNGQTYQRANIKDYQEQLAYWESRVSSEQTVESGATGVSPMRRIPIEFVRNP